MSTNHLPPLLPQTGEARLRADLKSLVKLWRDIIAQLLLVDALDYAEGMERCVEELEGTITAREDEPNTVKMICRRIGYGRVMQIASEAWREVDPNGAISLGPCFGTLKANQSHGREPDLCPKCGIDMTGSTVLHKDGVTWHEVCPIVGSAQAPETPPQSCATCQGRRWVMKSETHYTSPGFGSGGMWNEPCPDCAASSSDEQAEKEK